MTSAMSSRSESQGPDRSAGHGANDASHRSSSHRGDNASHRVEGRNTMSVLESVAVADIGQETVLRLAAAQPAGSNDPAEQAMLRATDGAHIGRVESFSPASIQRRYSLAAVRDAELLGERRDVAVMRGDVSSVVREAASSGEDRKILLKGVKAEEKLGNRCMAVAVAPLDGNQTGEFELKGYVSFKPGLHERVKPERRGAYTRVEMWPLALRIQHWLNLILIIALSMTGYYIMNPFFGPAVGQDTGYLFGIIRFIHFAAGFAWIVLALWRLSLLIFAKQRQMRWRSLWPIYNKQDAVNMWEQVKYYLFMSKHGPTHIGHNALQQFTYTGIYGLCIIQILTGLALYGLYDQYNIVWVILSYPIHWFGIPTIRLFHAIIMFIIWAFVVLHVYLAFRADALERHGGVSAMINGGVWMPSGTKPVDAPEID